MMMDSKRQLSKGRAIVTSSASNPYLPKLPWFLRPNDVQGCLPSPEMTWSQRPCICNLAIVYLFHVFWLSFPGTPPARYLLWSPRSITHRAYLSPHVRSMICDHQGESSNQRCGRNCNDPKESLRAAHVSYIRSVHAEYGRDERKREKHDCH